MTAVEWLFKELCSEKLSWNKDCNGKLFFDEITSNILQQAKEMEKKIIAQAFEDGDYNYFYNHKNGREFENGLEYYNEKFKSE